MYSNWNIRHQKTLKFCVSSLLGFLGNQESWWKKKKRLKLWTQIERERETCLEEKMEIGGVRGRKERLVEEELLEVFNGTMTRNRNGGWFAGYCTDLDFSVTLCLLHIFRVFSLFQVSGIGIWNWRNGLLFSNVFRFIEFTHFLGLAGIWFGFSFDRPQSRALFCSKHLSFLSFYRAHVFLSKSW